MVPAHTATSTTSAARGALLPGADDAPVEPRSDLDLARQQLQAIERWHDARRAVQEAAQTTTASREARMDLARRLDVIRAEHRAIVERTDAQLRSSVELLQRTAARRAVVVHRNTWFKDKVAAELTARRVEVVALLSNGAEAVGAAIAEQPDLLLVEDSLPMMSGEDVVREVRRFAPLTRIGAQVAYDARIAAMLEAGAHSACTRRVPPADVAAGLTELLAAEPARG
jgi:DNA-binding NarL/FixJ family response regulator